MSLVRHTHPRLRLKNPPTPRRRWQLWQPMPHRAKYRGQWRSGLLKTGFWLARDATRNSLREHGEEAAEQVEHTLCTEALCKRTENAVEPRLSLTDARCLTALPPLKHFF